VDDLGIFTVYTTYVVESARHDRCLKSGMTNRAVAFVGAGLLLASTGVAQAQGSATNVTVAPRTIVAGGTVSVTATGTNPCGAVRFNYGDGDAITYAITGLPLTQTHVYQKAGDYTITAEGMGNCAGAPTTTLTVTAPPAPPPPPATPAITALEMTPMPARTQEPVAITVRGNGSCTFDVQYGDGTAEQVEGRLPENTHHTYAKAGRYVVVVRPTAPCAGKFTQVLEVADAPGRVPARITRLVVSPSPAAAGQATSLTVDGEGACSFDIRYGDGTAEAMSGSLPHRSRHFYRPGRYVVVVKAEPPCTGNLTEVLQVADATAQTPPTDSAAQISGVIVRPRVPAVRQPVRLTIDGEGMCTFRIDYGDGNADSRSMRLPASLRHVYAVPDRYTVVVAPDDSRCAGSGRVSFDVRRE
jgi:hypothetical protein